MQDTMATSFLFLLLTSGLWFMVTPESSNGAVSFVGMLHFYQKGAKNGLLEWQYTPREAAISWIRCFYQSDGNPKEKHLFSHNVIHNETHYDGKLVPGGDYKLDKGLFKLIVPYPQNENDNLYNCEVEFHGYDDVIKMHAFLLERGVPVATYEGTRYYEKGDKEIGLLKIYNIVPNGYISYFFYTNIEKVFHIITYDLPSRKLINSFEERFKLHIEEKSITLISVNPTSEDQGYFISIIKFQDTSRLRIILTSLIRTVLLQTVRGGNFNFSKGDKEGFVAWYLTPTNARVSNVKCYRNSSSIFEIIYIFDAMKNTGTSIGALENRAKSNLQNGTFWLTIERPKEIDCGMYLCIFSWHGQCEQGPILVYSDFAVKASESQTPTFASQEHSLQDGLTLLDFAIIFCVNLLPVAVGAAFIFCKRKSGVGTLTRNAITN